MQKVLDNKTTYSITYMQQSVFKNVTVAQIITTKDAQDFYKFRNYLKIQGARGVTRSKFHVDDPQTLDDTVQKLVLRSYGICVTLLISAFTKTKLI
jgi:hypothetical protein